MAETRSLRSRKLKGSRLETCTWTASGGETDQIVRGIDREAGL